MLLHTANYRGKLSDYPLWKHAQMTHSGSLDVSYSMKVVRYFKEPLTRQVNEAVRIANCGASTKLNSNKEQTKPNFSAETGAEAEIRVPLKGNRNDFLEFRFRSCRTRNLVIKFGFNRILTEIEPKFKTQKRKEKEEKIYFHKFILIAFLSS